MTCGIYKITRKDTGQMYVGQSKNIENRWRQHCRNKNNFYIDRAIRKYGKKNFDFQIICELEQDDDLLNAMEEYYVWKYNTYKDKNHYNLTPGGDFNPATLPEVRAKMSKAKSGKNHPFFGRKHTPETKNKMSEAHSGCKHTPETRKKISKSHLGKKLPDEQKISISKTVNTSGYYRVIRKNDKTCKQGFRWVYQYYKNRKQKEISSVDIKKLEEKVRAKGLKWLKID